MIRQLPYGIGLLVQYCVKVHVFISHAVQAAITDGGAQADVLRERDRPEVMVPRRVKCRYIHADYILVRIGG